MFVLSLLAAASGLSAPALDDRASRRVWSDYPKWALRESKSAAAVVEVWTDLDGRIYDCKTLGTAGDNKLGQQICAILLRMKAKSATTGDGEPAYGRYKTTVFLTLPQTKQGKEVAALRAAPDAVISVAKLPDGLGEYSDIELALQVDKGGSIIDCAPQGDLPTSLGDAACKAFATEKMATGLDADGNVVSYVTNFKVRISLGEPA